jgi:hypothetical protein
MNPGTGFSPASLLNPRGKQQKSLVNGMLEFNILFPIAAA